MRRCKHCAWIRSVLKDETEAFESLGKRGWFTCPGCGRRISHYARSFALSHISEGFLVLLVDERESGSEAWEITYSFHKKEMSGMVSLAVKRRAAALECMWLVENADYGPVHRALIKGTWLAKGIGVLEKMMAPKADEDGCRKKNEPDSETDVK